MPLDARIAQFVEELFAPLGIISVRGMFSGGGIYCDGLMFGLIADNMIYLKADARTRGAFEAEGTGPFIYQGRKKPIAMSYWRLPDRLLDDPDEALAWGRRALEVAHAALTRRRAKTRTPK
jgi:DNA transformation protein and related proteins